MQNLASAAAAMAAVVRHADIERFRCDVVSGSRRVNYAQSAETRKL